MKKLFTLIIIAMLFLMTTSCTSKESVTISGEETTIEAKGKYINEATSQTLILGTDGKMYLISRDNITTEYEYEIIDYLLFATRFGTTRVYHILENGKYLVSMVYSSGSASVDVNKFVKQ